MKKKVSSESMVKDIRRSGLPPKKTDPFAVLVFPLLTCTHLLPDIKKDLQFHP